MRVTALGAGDQFTHVAYGHTVVTWGSSQVTGASNPSGGANGLGHGDSRLNAPRWQRQVPTQLPNDVKYWGTDTIVGIAGGFAFSAFRTATRVYIAGCAAGGGNPENNTPPGCLHQEWGDGQSGAARTYSNTAFVDMAIGAMHLRRRTTNAVRRVQQPGCCASHNPFQHGWWNTSLLQQQNIEPVFASGHFAGART